VPASARLDLWLGSGKAPGKILDEVRAALDDDLDTPRALAAIDEAAERGEDVTAAAALLGIPLN
jgi:L-cysteine:1D-myo-inositol 2-amino-2-deoxy-alpha-D-glucopyranoside ligase